MNIFLNNSDIKGIIFDLDGTILDSMPVWEEVDRIFLTENDIDPPKGVSDIVKKMSVEESAQYFINEFKMRHTQQYIINRIEEIVADKYAYEIPLKRGVVDFMDRLDSEHIPYCLATATYATLAEAALKRVNIYERFKFILTCSDIGSNKTSPDIYIECAKRLNTDINRTAVIEDALHCIETAKSAGFYTVGMYDDQTSAYDWTEIKRISDISAMNLYELWC